MDKPTLEIQLYQPPGHKSVYFYWEIFNSSTTPEIHTVLPSAYFQIVFPIRQSMAIENISSAISDAFICPILNKGKSIILQPGTRVFGMHMYPSLTSNLFRVHPSELIRNANPLHEVMDEHFAHSLSAMINGGDSFKDRVSKVDMLLSNGAISPDNLVEGLFTLMKKEPGARLQELFKQAGYGERWIQRKFANIMGSTPQELMSIVRFNLFLNRLFEIKNETLTNLALDCGYFDQSHCIHDFRKLSGTTPREFLKMNPSLNTVLNKF